MTRLQRTKRSNWKIASGHWDYTKKRQTIFHPIDLFVQTKRYKLDLLPTTKLWICYSKTVKETRHCRKDKETKKKKKEKNTAAYISGTLCGIIFTTAINSVFHIVRKLLTHLSFCFFPLGTCHGDKIIFLPRRIRLPQVNFCILKLLG